MTDVTPIHWPTDEDAPVRDGDLIGRQWRAEHAIAHAETGVCFPCWFGGHTACGIDPHCENTEKETHTVHAISLSCQALAMLDPTEPVHMGEEDV